MVAIAKGDIVNLNGSRKSVGMKGKEMKKGIIFDVDGTLWNACAVIADSWNDYLEKYAPDVKKRVIEPEVKSVMGMTMTDIGDTIFGMLPEKRRREVAENCFSYEVEYMKNRGGQVYPGAVEVFQELAGEFHLYICSNCQLGYIEDFINWTGTGHLIEDFLCYGDTGMTKDRNIRILAERNHLDFAVYVGDTQGDYESTRKAGYHFIHARYGFGKVDETVPYVENLKELPGVVRKLF